MRNLEISTELGLRMSLALGGMVKETVHLTGKAELFRLHSSHNNLPFQYFQRFSNGNPAVSVPYAVGSGLLPEVQREHEARRSDWAPFHHTLV